MYVRKNNTLWWIVNNILLYCSPECSQNKSGIKFKFINISCCCSVYRFCNITRQSYGWNRWHCLRFCQELFSCLDLSISLRFSAADQLSESAHLPCMHRHIWPRRKLKCFNAFQEHEQYLWRLGRDGTRGKMHCSAGNWELGTGVNVMSNFHKF